MERQEDDDKSMLEMSIDGTELKFEVKKYHPSTKDNWDCEWCQIFVSIHNRYIHYEMNGETLLCCEIEKIYTDLKDVLAGENVERCELSFAEPDYEMVIDVYKDKKVMLDWIFHLWNEQGTLSANSFTIVLSTEETAQMVEYLERIVK